MRRETLTVRPWKIVVSVFCTERMANLLLKKSRSSSPEMFKKKSHGYLSTWSCWHWHKMPSWTCVPVAFLFLGYYTSVISIWKRRIKTKAMNQSEWGTIHWRHEGHACGMPQFPRWAEKARVLLIIVQSPFCISRAICVIYFLFLTIFTIPDTIFCCQIYFMVFRFLLNWTHFHFFFSKMLINKISLYT